MWCEKPLALSIDELDQVEAAWEASGRQLMIGFNRRWSPAVRPAQVALAGMASPKFLVYRVAAGPVPDGSLVHRPAARRPAARRGLPFRGHRPGADRGRDRGDRVRAAALPRRRRRGRGPGNDAVVSLRFADGSWPRSAMAAPGPRSGKEWIEVTSGAHRLVIDDFRSG